MRLGGRAPLLQPGYSASTVHRGHGQQCGRTLDLPPRNTSMSVQIASSHMEPARVFGLQLFLFLAHVGIFFPEYWIFIFFVLSMSAWHSSV